MSMATIEETTISVDAVRFVKELYPRIKEDDAAIERYRNAIDNLPAIVVARGGVLVDGFHRWQAHKREGAETIRAEDLGDLSDAEIFNESIRRNSSHGHQLSSKDKKRLAGKLWHTHAHISDADDRYQYLAELLSVTRRSVERWTKDARQYEKNEQKAKAWDLWLDCLSERKIAEEIGVPQQTAHDWVTEKRQLSLFGHPPESRQHFDVWNFQRCDGDSSYFGRMPPQVVENLLWTYTDVGSIVFDPFAGGGTTIEVAKKMGRRVWSSDIVPSTPILPIHQHDILEGYPKGAPSKVDFVLLDPPYFTQAAGKYPKHDSQIGDIDDYPAFLDAWKAVLDAVVPKVAKGGHVAFIISPTQKKDGTVIDHAFDMARVCADVGLVHKRRFIVPYSTQQATGQQVEWAREKRTHLKLYRDLAVFGA